MTAEVISLAESRRLAGVRYALGIKMLAGIALPLIAGRVAPDEVPGVAAAANEIFALLRADRQGRRAFQESTKLRAALHRTILPIRR